MRGNKDNTMAMILITKRRERVIAGEITSSIGFGVSSPLCHGEDVDWPPTLGAIKVALDDVGF